MNKLEKVLYTTHYEAARRQNASTQVLIAAYQSNGGNLLKSISAAMQCFGGKHAPIKECYSLIERMQSGESKSILSSYELIPGFGSSFAKNRKDDLLNMINGELKKHSSVYGRIAHACQDYLIRYKGVQLFPNLGFYTAAICHYEQININFCEAIMIQARIECWINLLNRKEELYEMPKMQQ